MTGRTNPSTGICAVIVTFNPELANLLQVLRAIRGTVENAVLIDNASRNLDEALIHKTNPGLVVERLPANIGIAAAQNRGVGIARRCGANYLLFLDQDSIPQGDMVARLRYTYERLEREGHKVACVGPRVRMPDMAKLSDFDRLSWIGKRRIRCRKSHDAVECDVLISSGSLVALPAIDAIGPMEEDLFIDQVDTEWCLRARAAGYRIFGACGAVIEHRLGDSRRRLWFGRWRLLPRHKPFRYYYIFRNTLLLFRRRYVSLKWILYQLRWLGALFLLYGLLTRRRSGELAMMLKGVADGVRGVTGKLREG